MSSKPPLIRWWIVAVLSVAAAGCGQANFPHAEVIGEVLLDGEPVPAAHVLFTAKSGDKLIPATFCAAVIDGCFLFGQQDGPPPGEYDVVIAPVEPDSEELAAELLARQGSLIQVRNQFLAAVAKRGPLVVELSADDVNEVSIELSSR